MAERLDRSPARAVVAGARQRQLDRRRGAVGAAADRERRVREEYLLSGDNATAVADGLASTARVITAAAAVMIAVFLSFVLGDLRVLKLLGLGLATAIFVDATIVRAVLLPSSMKLLGEWNWYLPRALQRLPRGRVDAPAARDPA